MESQARLTGERVVLLRPGALGDALLTIPTLAVLRSQRPTAHVTLIARRDVLPVVMASGLADVALPYDLPAWSALFGTDPTLVDSLARDVLSGAAVVAWLADADGALAANLSALGAKRVVIRSPRPPLGERTHMALRLAAALLPLVVVVPTSRDALVEVLLEMLPSIRLPEADVEAARDLCRALGLLESDVVVALHPGSGGAAKRWPPESFAALANAIQGDGAQPLLIEGPQDREVCAAVNRMVTRRLPVVRDHSVARLAALLQLCSAYVGNDSGVSHLAGLLGRPTLVLFGPTDPAVWSPLGPRVLALCAPASSLVSLSPREVAAALRTFLAGTESS